MANVYHCKECGKESRASLCDTCFLNYVVDAIEAGETDVSKIFQSMRKKYGRITGLKNLKIWREIFSPQKIRRVITTEEGIRCKLVPTYSGLVAVAPIGEKSSRIVIDEYGIPTEKFTELPGESTEGSRIVTYYEGEVPIKEFKTPTALVFPRHTTKRTKSSGSRAPASDYRSPRLG